MKKRPMIFLLLAAVLLLVAYAISVRAQWDESEEPQRLEERQMEEAEQAGENEYEGTEIKKPAEETKGERTLQEFKDIPTGYVYRNYVIREQNLAGKWDKADILAQSGWTYTDKATYKRYLGEGTLDAKLKRTIFKPYYEKMLALCKQGIKASGAVHVRSLEKTPKWRVVETQNKPYAQYRELTFQCMAKGEKQ